MNQKGMDALLKGKVKLGRDATAAAGPSGATSANLGGTDMLSYARTGGLFAGMSLGGASIEPDDDANKDLYDKPMSPRDIMLGSAVQVPPAAKPLISTLDSKVAKHGK
jgi:lipid-binding SYLF domain-containing protein